MQSSIKQKAIYGYPLPYRRVLMLRIVIANDVQIGSVRIGHGLYATEVCPKE